MGSGSAVFHGIRDQANNKNKFRDQNSHRFWDQGSTFWAKIWDQLRKIYLVTTLIHFYVMLFLNFEFTEETLHTDAWTIGVVT